ncbi:MAG: type II toxin-antitoxin system HigB family toxin [Chloroflexaceae bacterium]|nr:type II toxin-antitoxin system HigB family toxin [Chloroflexaceae bacterium]
MQRTDSRSQRYFLNGDRPAKESHQVSKECVGEAAPSEHHTAKEIQQVAKETQPVSKESYICFIGTHKQYDQSEVQTASAIVIVPGWGSGEIAIAELLP